MKGLKWGKLSKSEQRGAALRVMSGVGGRERNSRRELLRREKVEEGACITKAYKKGWSAFVARQTEPIIEHPSTEWGVTAN